LYKNFETRFLEFFYFKFRKYIPDKKSILKYLFNDKKRRLGLERKHGVGRAKYEEKKQGKIIKKEGPVTFLSLAVSPLA
jgi:hypothetical protein